MSTARGDLMREIERLLALLKRHTRFWLIGEAAFLCACSERTIRRAIKAGKIQAIGDGRKRIPHSEIVKYCQGRDPLLEFSISIQTLDINADYSIRKIEELQARLDSVQR
ncbi:MAG: helix-turn-helix domain-containing protein [Blastocatellia bacterium]